MFIKKEYILNFDENLGVGARFGSCEDADLIYKILEKGIYTPKIELWQIIFGKSKKLCFRIWIFC